MAGRSQAAGVLQCRHCHGQGAAPGHEARGRQACMLKLDTAKTEQRRLSMSELVWIWQIWHPTLVTRRIWQIWHPALVTRHDLLFLRLRIYLQPAVSLPAVHWACPGCYKSLGGTRAWLPRPTPWFAPDKLSCCMQKEEELHGLSYNINPHACGEAMRKNASLLPHRDVLMQA